MTKSAPHVESESKSKATFAVIFVFLGLVFFSFGLVISHVADDRSRTDLTDRNVYLPEVRLPYLHASDQTELLQTELLSEWRGPLLVNIWASWCVGCRLEHDELLQMQALGIPIYGINMMDRSEDAQKWLQQHKSPYLVNVADIRGDTTVSLSVTGLPQTLLVDADGAIVWRKEGSLTGDDVNSILEQGFSHLQVTDPVLAP